MLWRRRKEPSGEPDLTATVQVEAVPPRYQRAVADALAARTKYATLVGQLRPGPLQDQLLAMSPKVDAGVLAVWEAVQRTAGLESFIDTGEADRARDELKAALRDPTADPDHVAVLSDRFATTQELLNTLEAAQRERPILEARLDAVVGRVALLTYSTGTDGVDDLRAQLDSVVVGLDAIAQATRELDGH